jgi:CRISPR-associated protein Cas2
MSLYLAAYDISDDHRRERVARRLLQHGQRIQQSVYELWLEPEDLPLLRLELGSILARSDSFHLFPLDERGTRKSIAWQRELDNLGPVVVS